jgi:hypothetical protein
MSTATALGVSGTKQATPSSSGNLRPKRMQTGTNNNTNSSTPAVTPKRVIHYTANKKSPPSAGTNTAEPSMQTPTGSSITVSTPTTGTTTGNSSSLSNTSTLADLNDTEKEKMIRIVKELILEKQQSQQLAAQNAQLTALLNDTNNQFIERERDLLSQVDAFTQKEQAGNSQVEDLTAKYGMSLGLLKLYQAKLNGFATAHRINKIKVLLCLLYHI